MMPVTEPPKKETFEPKTFKELAQERHPERYGTEAKAIARHERIARVTGMARQSINRIENGGRRMRYDTACALVEAMDLDMSGAELYVSHNLAIERELLKVLEPGGRGVAYDARRTVERLFRMHRDYGERIPQPMRAAIYETYQEFEKIAKGIWEGR